MNYKEITEAYWAPERGVNPSADIPAGNKIVDHMTLNELTGFFAEYTCGPTYCLVKQRVLENLEKLPPTLGIKSAETQAFASLVKLQIALQQLQIERITF